MADVKSCGPLCQHPSCWNDDKVRMIEALRSFYESQLKQNGAKKETKATSYHPSDQIDGICQESLPTLKIVNIFGTEEDDQYDDDLDQSSYILHLLKSGEENPLPISSAGTRASWFPKAPCASPSPSYASQYFNGKRKTVRKALPRSKDSRESSDNTKATNIQIQESDSQREDQTQSFVPYLVWVPSKRNKKQNNIDDLESDRSKENPKVAMKNVTGTSHDFGFLSTPFSRDTALKCYSRATHTVRSSPNRLQPRRLPPISRDASDRSRSPRQQPNGLHGPDIRLTGDGLLKSEKRMLTIGTPQNTRASIFTTGKLEEWNSRDSARQLGLEEQPSLCIVNDDTLIIHHGLETNSLKRGILQENRKLIRGSKDVKELRAELPLPRVTVPRAKLSRLPIDNHCRNSIPSHNLPDIEMQPVYGMDRTISNVTSIENSANIESTFVPDGVSDEVQLSEEQYQKLFETVVTDKRNGLEEEDIYCHWEDESLQAPAPTPASPQKKLEPARLGDADFIEVIREEQFKESTEEPIGNTQAHSDTVTNAVGVDAYRGSPVLSKSSSGDWSSDKDLMRKTYEQYRSFTPFKTPGISLVDARLESIKEASREHTYLTERERSILSSKAHTLPMNSRVNPNQYRKAARRRESKKHDSKLKLANKVPLPLRSFIRQRRSYVEKMSDLKVSTLKHNRRKAQTEYLALSHDHLEAPFLVKKVSLQDPTTKLHHDNIPGYEVYESLVRSSSRYNDDSEHVPYVIQVPNPTPDKESIKSKSLVSLCGIGACGSAEDIGLPISSCDMKEAKSGSLKSDCPMDTGLSAESPKTSAEAFRGFQQSHLKNGDEQTFEETEKNNSDRGREEESFPSSADLTRKPGMLPETKMSHIVSESESEQSFGGCINLLSDIASDLDFNINLNDNESQSFTNEECDEDRTVLEDCQRCTSEDV